MVENNGIVTQKMDLDSILGDIDKLNGEEKAKLAQYLLGKDSGLTVIVGGSNVVNNGIAFQVNSDPELIASQLGQCSSETIESLMKAIAMRISSG